MLISQEIQLVSSGPSNVIILRYAVHIAIPMCILRPKSAYGWLVFVRVRYNRILRIFVNVCLRQLYDCPSCSKSNLMNMATYVSWKHSKLIIELETNKSRRNRMYVSLRVLYDWREWNHFTGIPRGLTSYYLRQMKVDNIDNLPFLDSENSTIQEST